MRCIGGRRRDDRRMKIGQVVILNGAPRSGKSSIVAAIQRTFDGPWMNLGVDVFVRELRGPMPEVETIPTGGINGENVQKFLGAGAVAVGIGSALLKADPDQRRSLVESVRGRAG
jgi:chloramphenicol 3-O-phosphotransferase